jgi:NAD(P)-dependent dehydrogenase (short-subunit alcohol dehydrogenase family)
VPADHVVVHVVAAAAAAKPIEELSDADIESQYDSVVRAALSALQTGRAAGATRFVFVLPSLAERGAGGYATTCAAAEAVRVLALGAARQWNDEGVTVNCISRDSADDDIAPLVEFLSSGTANGETLRVGGPAHGLK